MEGPWATVSPDSDVADVCAVVCTHLTKDYGGGHGVFDLDLQVARGETFGFIGPNGAGKTTTIRLLMDLVRPDRGTAQVLGLDSRRDSLAIKRRVGYLPGELVAFPGVRAGYVIGLMAGLRGGVPRAPSVSWPNAFSSTSDADTRSCRTATSRRSG